jgi:two-component system sensor histidine kinase CpxA
MVPKSLFLKIFLWFWLAMTLVGAALLITTEITRPDVRLPRWREFTGDTISYYAERSAAVLEEGGREALDSYLEEIEQTSQIRATVFDSQGNQVSGHSAPRGADELIARAQGSTEVQYQPRGRGSMLVARNAEAPDGRTYTIVANLPGPRMRPPIEVTDLIVRLLTILCTAGLVCYGLARHLTSPVSRLQTAVRDMSAGNLSTRVEPGLRTRNDEFADLGRDFDFMAEKIEGLVGAQRQLLRDISHELRSPLARLNVALELARKRSGADARASLDRIELESERMNELIGQLLRLAQLEDHVDGGEPAAMESVQLADLVQEVATDADFEASGQNRGVNVLEARECVTTGSADLLRSAIENIVRNAVRYTREESQVEISLHQTSHRHQPCAHITVRDRGPGVPEASLEELFRPFYRVGDARDRQSGGIGLGLAIAERIIRLHGGTLTASNARGGGLQVEVHLPLDAKE